jgi:single-strand DNA-binding protein
MNETHVTLVGNVVTDVTVATTQQGFDKSTFRMAATSRRFDRGLGQWVDGDTSYVRVNCWRRLARNVAESLTKGDPVVVTGTLRVREWASDDGRRGVSVEVEAVSIGHDLARGVTAFTRPAKREGSMASDAEGAPAAAPFDAADQPQAA